MIERHALKNGMRVLAQGRPESLSTSVVVFVKTGSRNETEKNNGISHFLEHTVFKGTKKRVTYKEINRELDSLGARHDAFTGVEYTGYIIHASKDHFENVLDLLSDIVFEPTFPEKEISKERGTILQEISMYEDSPSDLVTKIFHNIVSEDAYVAQDVLGIESSVKSMGADEIGDYHRKQYTSNNSIIGCSGYLPEKYLDLIDKYFSRAHKGENILVKSKDNPLLEKKVVLKTKDIEQANFALGGVGLSKGHPDRYVSDLLLFILGGGMSSRLWTEVREKRGLAYVINAGSLSWSDCGYYEVYAGVSPDKAYEAIDLVKKELTSIKKDISIQELEMAKSHIIGVNTLSEENLMTLNFNNVKDELSAGGAISLKERTKNYEKVTVDDLKRVAENLFKPEKMKLAVIGPFKDGQKFVKILEG